MLNGSYFKMNKRTFHIQINIHTLRQKKKSPIQKMYSKASISLASSCTDFAGAPFWIGSKKIWAERIHVVKPWGARFFEHLSFTLLSNKGCTSFFFLPKTCISRPYCNWNFADIQQTTDYGHPMKA